MLTRNMPMTAPSASQPAATATGPARRLALMKPTAVVINTAPGELLECPCVSDRKQKFQS